METRSIINLNIVEICGEILNISSDISWQIVWKIIVSKDSNSMHLEERQTIGEEKVEERSNIPILETFFSSKLFLNNIFPLPYHASTTPSFEIRFLRYPLLGFIHASLYSRFPRKHVF